MLTRVAEQKPFGDKGGWVRQPGRIFKFKEGESLEDVRARANEVVSKYIEPVLRETRGQPPTGRHVVVVAHGIFNAEFIGALMARTRTGAVEWGYRGQP